jgi:hypothetical protein
VWALAQLDPVADQPSSRGVQYFIAARFRGAQHYLQQGATGARACDQGSYGAASQSASQAAARCSPQSTVVQAGH